MMTDKPLNHYKPWTKEWDQELVQHILNGKSWKYISRKLQRTELAVYHRYLGLLNESHNPETEGYKIELQQKLISLSTRPAPEVGFIVEEVFESNEDLLAQDESIHREKPEWTEEKVEQLLRDVYIGQKFFFCGYGPHTVKKVYITINGDMHIENTSGAVFPSDKIDWVDLIVE